MYAFTAWDRQGLSTRDLDEFASLKAVVKGNSTLDIVGWMNGMAFFTGMEPKPVLFNWPAYWKEVY